MFCFRDLKDGVQTFSKKELRGKENGAFTKSGSSLDRCLIFLRYGKLRINV